MNNKTELSHHKLIMAQWDKYKRMLSRKLGKIPSEWLILSDYCLDDPHKNSCATFTISPMQDLGELKRILQKSLPRDFKDITNVPKETLRFIKEYKYFFSLSIIFEDIKQSEIIADLREAVEYILKHYTDMPDKMRRNIVQFREYLKKGNKNCKVLKNLVLVSILVSHIIEFLTIKHSAQNIRWISDRDAILDISDGVILDYIRIITSKLIRGRKKLPKLGIGIGNKHAKIFDFDAFIRYPDIITGAVASLDYYRNGVRKIKHFDLLTNAIFKNRNILILLSRKGKWDLIKYK